LAIFLELSKKHPHFVLPDRKALNPEVIGKLKLKFMLDNFEKSTQTPHLMAKIPGSMIHPEQDVMMFDFSNRLAKNFLVFFLEFIYLKSACLSEI